MKTANYPPARPSLKYVFSVFMFIQKENKQVQYKIPFYRIYVYSKKENNKCMCLMKVSHFIINAMCGA